MNYIRRIGQYTYQWEVQTLETFKGEVILISLDRVSTDTVIGFISDTIAHRLKLHEEIPMRGGADFPILITVGDSFEVISGHNTVVWHLHNGSGGLACHVYTEAQLTEIPHLKTQDWQYITGT